MLMNTFWLTKFTLKKDYMMLKGDILMNYTIYLNKCYILILLKDQVKILNFNNNNMFRFHTIRCLIKHELDYR